MTHIRSLTVQGFRPFGRDPQTLSVADAPIVAVWGPNSKGKTSLAEAFEFLLTGRIVRRELMASSQDEFADALRNAHLPDDVAVSVSAEIETSDGSVHAIERRLLEDYSRRENCRTELVIDGTHAAEADLAKYGIVLSQPPLEAPVLAQHTLAYIFSARPQDRAVYFKTLLQVTDLDHFRNVVAALQTEVSELDDPLLAKFDRCSRIPSLLTHFLEVEIGRPDKEILKDLIHSGAATLVERAGEPVPELPEAQLAKVAEILREKRSRTFPVQGFDRKAMAHWTEPEADKWERLRDYIDERAKVDAETQQLTSLFVEALKLPGLDKIERPTDCPICGIEDALKPERITLIRQHVENNRSFRTAESAARIILQEFQASSNSLRRSIQDALPSYLRVTSDRRRSEGFTVERIYAILNDEAKTAVAPWLVEARSLSRAAATLRRQMQALVAKTNELAEDPSKLTNVADLSAEFDGVTREHGTLSKALTSYVATEKALTDQINAVLDAQSDTAGWQDLLDTSDSIEALHAALVERRARATVRNELEAALRQIDRAKEQVLNDKFAELSDKVQVWWELLRPEEPTFFTAVRPRPGGRRNIDFKAGLSPNPDRSHPKIRDVIAVFSQSQLHCLGLALFLARVEHEGASFVVLDDPVLSADEDYRVHFERGVINRLLHLNIQAILLTQDEKSWRDLDNLYRHKGISMSQLAIESPARGAVIWNTSDELLAKIARAESLGRGGHHESRKEAGRLLRTAGENFCKELLVKQERAQGNTRASWSDYEGKTLEWLCPRVDPLLAADPSHSGKLRVFRDTTNPPAHDDLTPSPAQMITAAGDLRYFVKVYLNR